MTAKARELRQRIYSQMIRSEKYNTEEENVACNITYTALGCELTVNYDPTYGYTMGDGVTVIEDYEDMFDYVVELFLQGEMEKGA